MKRRRPPPLASLTGTRAPLAFLEAPPVAYSKAEPCVAAAVSRPSVSLAPVVRMVCGDIPCIPISAPAAPEPVPSPIVSLSCVRRALARWYIPHHRRALPHAVMLWSDLSKKLVRAVGSCRICTWHCVCNIEASGAGAGAVTGAHGAGNSSYNSTASAGCLHDGSGADESWIPGCG